MTTAEAELLFEKLHSLWPDWKINQDQVDGWMRVLRKYEYAASLHLHFGIWYWAQLEFHGLQPQGFKLIILDRAVHGAKVHAELWWIRRPFPRGWLWALPGPDWYCWVQPIWFCW